MNGFRQHLSRDRRYCWWWSAPLAETLHRNTVLFVLLNPSDKDVPDGGGAVVRKCLGYARRWGHDSVVGVNLFALRSHDPMTLLDTPDPVGARNDYHIRTQADLAQKIVVAWGNHGRLAARDRQVLHLLRGFDLFCLGWTRCGAPTHPAHAAYTLPLVPYPFGRES